MDVEDGERILEEPVQYLLKPCTNHATMDADVVQVSRVELEQERRHLIGRLRWLNSTLGYPPILTGKEERRQAAAK